MYQEAAKRPRQKRRRVQALSGHPELVEFTVMGHTDAVVDSCSYFSDLFAAVFVASTKIMSSVRSARTL